MEFAPEGERGAFNYGLSYLERINDLFKAIDTAFYYDDFDGQFKILNILWGELAEWFDDKEKEQHDKLRTKCRESYRHIRELNKLKKGIPFDVLESFWQWNVELRKLMHKKGLTMRHSDDPTMALGGKHY
jgi:DNA phosphorothioation-dependent restriction protein DptG